ncbi:MAG: 3,4-dihydroxy-2-butanone-4-phosphate synthase [Alphaproteobacteria bacterium TMED199]|nr:MAG: 3,4-dihydroxy-2-butanone-4-phosphate synthase [Alphaproteobacteria bacterium TMED199]
MALSNIKDVIKDASKGKIFILVDDENRENEGDLCVLGEFASPDAINFMAKYGRGLICLSLTRSQSENLGLSLMERRNEGRFETAFTVSIEATNGVTTGISAADRSTTIKTAINPNATKNEITTPGHVFPLISKDGGTLIRAGHTEAVVDIAKLANANPSGVICEIMKDNGEMARLPDLITFSKKHKIKIGSISDLISYRRKNEIYLKRVSESILESKFGGVWRIIIYKNIIDQSEHIALVKGVINPNEIILVRVHALDLLSDVLGKQSIERNGSELSSAMETIANKGKGIIILIRDLSPESLSKRISKSLKSIQKQPTNIREYGVGAQILSDLGVKNMTVLSNNKANAIGLEGFDLTIKNWEKLG